MIAVPAKCYEQRAHRGTKLVCEANGRRLIFLKPRDATVEKIIVDGCVLLNRVACDYLVIDWRRRKHFVELKGKGVEHALRQLEETIPEFVDNAREKFWCFVISSGTPPRILPGLQNAKARISRQWKNAEIKIKTGMWTHRLD